MPTAEDGGATAASNSSYGGGGAGGKFRKKPFRRQTTPYDRPPTALRANTTTNNGGWLTKLVLDPASRILSYGAQRFFGSVLQRRLPAPPPPQAQEVNHNSSEGHREADPITQNGVQEPPIGEHIQPVSNSSGSGISELEKLLNQKTFTRYEVDHLTELLKSRAIEVSPGDEWEKVKTASIFGLHEKFEGGPLDNNRHEENRSRGIMSTPVGNTKVLDDDIGSPAELAKAYMGSRPSKVSPSVLGMHSQVREDRGLSNKVHLASTSPIFPLTSKTSVSLGAPENGFVTPRSRGRSAIYNMARTPYSRIHPTSILRDGGSNHGYTGLPRPSSSLSLLEHDEKLESKPMTLKRRSSVLEDEVGSVGPIRRTRQKHNLITSRIPNTAAHEVGAGSARQKLPMIGGAKDKVSKTVGDNGNESSPSTSYARVPPRSSEMAAKIFQHLEDISPKEKSSESKLVDVKGKSPFKLTSGMLRGQALRSMEDVHSSKFLRDVEDDRKMEDRHTATMPDTHDSTSRKHEEAEETNSREAVALFDTWNSAKNNDSIKNHDSAVSLKASDPSKGTGEFDVTDGASRPLQKKRAFRMSAQEDSFEHDEDVNRNGVVLIPVTKVRVPTAAPVSDVALATDEGPKLVNTTIQPEVKSSLGFPASKTSEVSGPGSVKAGEATTGRTFPDLMEASRASQSAVSMSAAALDKVKEANSSPPLLNFSSTVAEKSPSLRSEGSSKVPESKPESSGSLVYISAPTSCQPKVPNSDNGGNLYFPKSADGTGKLNATVPSAASNGPFASIPPVLPFTSASSSETNQVPTTGASLFTALTSTAMFSSISTSTSTSTASFGSIFGSAIPNASSIAPTTNFSSPTDQSTSVSVTTTFNSPGVADSKRKAEADQSYGNSTSSNSTIAAFSAAGAGSNIFGLTSLASNSATNSVLFSGASNSVGMVPQGSSMQSVSSASSPSFNINSSSSFGSSLSNSKMFNSNSTFQFNSSSSSSDTGAVVPVSDPTSTVAKSNAGSGAISDGSTSGSKNNASLGIFSFGLSSSSSSTNAIGSSTSGNSPAFNFGGSSAVPTSVFNNTSTSFGSGTSGVFKFGENSSASSSAANSISSTTAANNIFGSDWQNKSPGFGTSLTSPSQSSGFVFGASSTSSTLTKPTSSIFNASAGASSSPVFPFSAVSTPAISTPSQTPAPAQPIFGSGFAASPGNNSDQMNAEDSMAEDPVQVQPSPSVFSQQAIVPPSPPGFMFGQTVPQQPNPFQFGGQQNQAALNPNPFQASGSLEFNAGGSFSLGSGGEKSNRRMVKISKNRNRKK